jgi:hypothetical protein
VPFTRELTVAVVVVALTLLEDAASPPEVVEYLMVYPVIVLPPLFGAVQESDTDPFDGTALSPLGALGTLSAGLIGPSGNDCADEPKMLVAVKAK